MFKKKVKVEDIDQDKKAAELDEATETVEAEKERRKLEREERKFLKEEQRKSQRRQRFVAPILLFITLLVSFLIWKLSN